MFLQVRVPELLARSSIAGSHLPGGRVDLEDTVPRIDNPRIVLDPVHFLKGGMMLAVPVKLLLSIVYQGQRYYGYGGRFAQ